MHYKNMKGVKVAVLESAIKETSWAVITARLP